MIIKELIKELEKYDGNTPVITTNYGGFHPIIEVKGDKKIVELIVNTNSIF